MSEYFEELKKMIDPGKGYDMERIEKAYLLAEKAHSGQFRASGEPYIVHPVEAAKITVQLGMDTDTVVTALLHDVVEDTNVTLEEIKKEFGTDVANLVDADLLILMSDIDGFYNGNPNSNRAQLIPVIDEITDEIRKCAGGEGTRRGTGGMITKLNAAEIVTQKGTDMVITNGAFPENLYKIVNGENVGTRFMGKR